mgnify:CR=1 FL=1
MLAAVLLLPLVGIVDNTDFDTLAVSGMAPDAAPDAALIACVRDTKEETTLPHHNGGPRHMRERGAPPPMCMACEHPCVTRL